MTTEKRYTLEDVDFSQCKNVTSLTPEGVDETAILLRLVEGAGELCGTHVKRGPI